jgi:exosortase
MRLDSDCGNILSEAVGEIDKLIQTSQKQVQHLVLYIGWVVASLIFFWRQLAALTAYALGNDNASHILLIPFLCGWLLFLQREQIFSEMSYDPAAALFPFVLAMGAVTWSPRSSYSAGPTSYALALALLWISGFTLIFGRNCLKKARFSMLFLLLMTPLPEGLLNQVVYFLQKGSAEIASGLFDLTGVPVLREGFIFHLGRVSIEIAKECSGIRSSMALLILALLAAHLFLRTFWRKTVFVLAGILLMIVKNGIRIVTLTLLALYVDPGFLFGKLHHGGGVVFFVLALLFYAPFLLLLQWSEKLRERNSVLPAARQSS